MIGRILDSVGIIGHSDSYMVSIVANSLYIGSLCKIKWHYDRGVKKWYYYAYNKEVFYDGEQDVVIEVNQEEDEDGIFVHIDAYEPENVKECEVDEKLEDKYAHIHAYVPEDKKDDWISECIHLPTCNNQASYRID